MSASAPDADPSVPVSVRLAARGGIDRADALRPNTLRNGPDRRGRFGIFGGRFVAETLTPLILKLDQAYEAAKADPPFRQEPDLYLKDHVGRPSPLWHARRLGAELGGAVVASSLIEILARSLDAQGRTRCAWCWTRSGRWRTGCVVHA